MEVLLTYLTVVSGDGLEGRQSGSAAANCRPEVLVEEYGGSQAAVSLSDSSTRRLAQLLLVGGEDDDHTKRRSRSEGSIKISLTALLSDERLTICSG